AHNVTAQIVAHTNHQLIEPWHVNARHERPCYDQLYGSGDQIVHAIDLTLRRAPTDRRPLHRPVRPGAVVLGQAETGACPPEGAKDFPKFQVCGVDLPTRDTWVATEQVGVGAKTADRQVAVAEAPGVGANPAEIAHRIANMGNLPIQDGNNTICRHHD